MEGDLSADVQAFISQHIVSVEELEVLLLLHDEPGRMWSPAEINVQLRSQEFSIRKWLAVLVAAGAIGDENGCYRFSPRSEELRGRIEALIQAYRVRPLKVAAFIFAKPNENLLNFVRAFDLRKRP